MLVIENSGEVTFANEVDVFNSYTIVDMTFIPTADIYEIVEG